MSLMNPALLAGGCVLKEQRLHGDLLAGYNRQTRPVLNESDTVHLQLGVGFIDFTLVSKPLPRDCVADTCAEVTA